MFHASATLLHLSLLAALLSAVSCNGGPSPSAQAEAFCACVHPLDSLNAQFSEALAIDDELRAMELLESLSLEATRVRACLREAALPADVATVDERRLRPRLDAGCPGWEAILGSLPLQ